MSNIHHTHSSHGLGPELKPSCIPIDTFGDVHLAHLRYHPILFVFPQIKISSVCHLLRLLRSTTRFIVGCGALVLLHAHLHKTVLSTKCVHLFNISMSKIGILPRVLIYRINLYQWENLGMHHKTARIGKARKRDLTLSWIESTGY